MSTSVLQNVIHPKSSSASPRQEGGETAEPTEEMELVLGVLVENAPVAMAMFDHQMHYILANRAWIEEFGLQNVQPLVGKSQYEIFPGLHPGWRQVYERSLQGHIIRSEHDALAGPDGSRVIYRWEVRPWRRRVDAAVGGLMVTCERFGQSTIAGAEADAAKAEPSLKRGLSECAVPMIMLDAEGTVLQSNQAAASLCLSEGLQEGTSVFWDIFAEASQRPMVKQQLVATLGDLAEQEEMGPRIFDLPATMTPQVAWTDKEQAGGKASVKPTRWLLARAMTETSSPSFTAVALPPEPAPRIPFAPPHLPAIANAVAAIAQPPTAEGLNASLELRRLQDDLARARQELRTLHEAGRTFTQRDARAKQYLDVLPCGVLVLDELGAPVYQNEPLTKLLGRPIEKEQTVEQWLAAACPSEGHREDVATLWRDDVWRRQLTRTFSLATADGLLKELEFQPSSLPGGGLLLCIQDATEKCRHEEQLRATEAKFRTLLQSAPLPVVLMDKTGSVFDVNHLAESFFGHPRHELRRYPLDAWLEPESGVARRERLRHMAQDQQAEAHLEVLVKQADGAPVPARLHLAQVTDSEGDPHCTIHFFESAPRLAPVAGTEASEETQEPSPEVPMQAVSQRVTRTETLLFQTNVHGRIHLCTARGAELLGLSEEEAYGRPLHAFFRPSDATGFYAELALLALTPDQQAELICYSAEGEKRPCQVKVSPGKWSGADFLISEVVESTQAEAAPMTVADVAEPPAVSAMSHILAGMAPWPAVNLEREKLLLSETHHRIKNHLQIISSLLNLESNTITDTTAREALRSSQNRVRSIADLHQHLYQMALGTDESFIDFATGLLARLRECYEVPADRVTVHLDLQAGVIQQEWLMPLALTLNETLSNCFEHAFPDERCGRVQASLTFGKSFGELVVKDDGIGMSESQRPGSGPGLGLKILAVFAEQMRGQLQLGQVDSGGTEIRLRFPIASADN